ncbi:MAG: glycosyltransferase family 2 protein [Lachnotalea sp.]
MKKKILAILTIIFSMIYIVWRTFYTIPVEFGTFSMVCGIILLFVETIGMFESVIHFSQMSNMKYATKAEVEDKDFPDVDIFISTYNEPTDLLFKTINGCLHMDYPDKSKVHIYLCDDGHRDEMGELCKKMGGITHLVRDTHEFAKAGNLNYALSVSSSPYVVTFDADMIPRRDFLTACMPYILTGEKIGFIQTPQTFYNPDLFQYNLYSENRLPNEQDYFYRDVQVMRNSSNSVIYGGTNTILSRQALIDVGGIATGVITEDFATGILMQSKGYQCYAIDESHASGLAPEDLKSLIKQRARWARGCIQTGKKINILFTKGLTIKQKASYITSITYWYGAIKRFCYIMAPILYSVFGVVVVKCTIPQILLFWLPMYLLNNQSLKALSNNITNVRWTNVYQTILFPSLFLEVILETIGFSQKKFAVTKKDGRKGIDKGYKYRQAFPHVIFLILSMIGAMTSIYGIFIQGSPAGIILLFWLGVNIYNLSMSVFFMFGREYHRKTERFDAELDCIVEYEGKKFETKTKDISEDGVSVKLHVPQYINCDKGVKITVTTPDYQSTWLGRVVNVVTMEDYWKYGIKIVNLEECEKNEWYQIIYDREPTMPKFLPKKSSTVDDFMINISKRVAVRDNFNRTLPRIPVYKWLQTLEGPKIFVNDFNFENILIKKSSEKKAKQKLSIIVSPEIIIKCTLKNDDLNCFALYKVDNCDEFTNNDGFAEILHVWLNEYRQEERNEAERIKIYKKNKGKEEFDSEVKYV